MSAATDLSLSPRSAIARAARRAFTLTELLVVIAIIAILVALVSTGVIRAMATAKATRVKVELDQIDSGMKAFKERYGAYPPCDLRVSETIPFNQLKQFMATAFPRYNLANLQSDIKLALEQSTTATLEFRPDQALVLWLRGLSPDPSNPFITRNNFQISGGSILSNKVTPVPFFEFDTTRLVGIDTNAMVNNVNMFSYFPVAGTPGSNGAPYVFFDYRSYGDAEVAGNHLQFNTTGFQPNASDTTLPFTAAGTAAPYARDNDGDGLCSVGDTWLNPDSIQIIATGLDNKYGVDLAPTSANLRYYPNGKNYASDFRDDDNATNFTSKARIGDDKP